MRLVACQFRALGEAQSSGPQGTRAAAAPHWVPCARTWEAPFMVQEMVQEAVQEPVQLVSLTKPVALGLQGHRAWGSARVSARDYA